jgi:hypothetical protein
MSAVLSIDPFAAQRAAERQAWAQYMAAVGRADDAECVRLWPIYKALHAQRPAEMIWQMEREQGLL